jgi:hypothetical protein
MMLEIISEIRPYLEAAFFLAGVALVLGLFLAYRKLNLLRFDINLRNERASKEQALRACERYFGAYVKNAGANYEERETKKIPGYNGPVGDLPAKSIPQQLLRDAATRLGLDTILPVLNELESIASSFITGVADEQTGFKIIGHTFCSTVENHYDEIALYRTKVTHDY